MITQNNNYGVCIDQSSTPILGDFWVNWKGFTFGGFNRFDNPGAYDVYNQNNTTIKAKVNWWDTFNNYGPVSIHPSADELGGGLPPREPRLLAGGMDSEDFMNTIFIADSLMGDSLYDAAMNVYSSLLDSVSEDTISLMGLTRLIGCYKKAKLDQNYTGSLSDEALLIHLDQIQTTYTNTVLGNGAWDYTVTLQTVMGNRDNALSRSELLVDHYLEINAADEDIAFALLEQAFLIEDESSGSGRLSIDGRKGEIVNRITREYPHTEAAKIVSELTGIPYQPKEDIDIPNEFALHSPFPNPFNSTVTIPFELSQESIVSLNIYDIVGREINSLVDNQSMREGFHAIQWRGTNQSGHPVSSGMYFYKIIAKSRLDHQNHEGIQKIILLK